MERSSAILERFKTLYPREIDLSLERMRVLLAKLGNPERRIPPVIHVAGTNGKGSTTAFLRAMIEAAGYTAHVYTSPHLVRFHERIRLGRQGGGRFVDEDTLVEALLEVERANAGAPIPQFEITTAAAVVLFADHPADFTLLEVGLGGRYDATNIVDDPIVAAITSISMDHEKFFGNTLAEIAREKAGIIKRDRPVVVAPQPAEVMDVIEANATRLGAPVFAGNRDWVAYPERGRLVFQDEDGLLDLPSPRLPGRHQYGNAGIAIAAHPPRPPAHPHGGDRSGADQRRLAGAPAAPDQRRPHRPRRSGCRALARRRPQSRRRPGHRRGHGRPRGTGAAAALPHLRHAHHQGPGRLLPALRRAGRARSSRCRYPRPMPAATRPSSPNSCAAPACSPSPRRRTRRPSTRSPPTRRGPVRRASSSSARSTSPAPCLRRTGRRRRSRDRL